MERQRNMQGSPGNLLSGSAAVVDVCYFKDASTKLYYRDFCPTS